ncbi:cobalamin biosynthesis protein [Halomonas caseinilytica]|uniref:Cobalt-precorrin 5A hydrolase n=1 Tax=Halomonas caseinilytica TaxID=438744 RepID=A0A1M6Y6S8_9GAMM|nr:cobalamin biosynthesis protein [Halomonas caseinilytica]SEN19042.1 cobalt-precorrin 5A hydrolase [Halomonas caseinilytica]SHL13695.1 cobalt-precorrin 5A hydrolase [Halomonas caseinilytica]
MKVAGFGFRRSATLASLAEALDRLETCHGPVDRLAVAASMRPLVQALGEARGLVTRSVADLDLTSVATLTDSRHSRQSRGTGSVAEAVALLAAGPGARLLGPRLISTDRRATAAVAVVREATTGDTT